MTDFRDQSDQNGAEKECVSNQSESTIKMCWFFIKILFLFCIWNSGLGLRESGAESAARGETFTKNESASGEESTLTGLLQERPLAVVVELKEFLLEKVKAVLRQETEANFPIQTTLLATFDSRGLRDVSVHNDTFDVRRAISDLRPTVNERETFSPTFRILQEVLGKGLREGFILLLTASRPSDEFLSEELIKSLVGKRCKLSILWAGNYQSDEYLPLKDVAESSGGRFGYVTSDDNSDENAEELPYPKSEFENLPRQMRFPEDSEETTEKETPTVLRAADQKVIQKTIPLVIEVASGSLLEAKPGTYTKVQFNVKNNLNLVLPVGFSAKYNGILQSVMPPRIVLQPSETALVSVNLFSVPILSGVQSTNAVGTLTLIAEAANKVLARSALIYLTPQTIRDSTAPKMTYKYDGDCTNYKEPQNCEQGQWNLEVTLHDEDSGLLKVLSEPYGLLFQSEFVAGTKTPVTVFYRATCCQPNVIIWAEDLKGNYVKKSFDVFNQNLLAGEIAGIVLGVLLILFIIIAVIVGVILYKRRNRRNMIIPRPRSNSR